MFSPVSTPHPTPKHPVPRPTARRDSDDGATRVIVGPPIGGGRVAFVHRLDGAPTSVPGDAEVLIALYGHRPGSAGSELLLQTAVRRCDLWNGDFDESLRALVLWTGWAVTRIERREIASAST